MVLLEPFGRLGSQPVICHNEWLDCLAINLNPEPRFAWYAEHAVGFDSRASNQIE